jgi:hypothetical protein
MNAISHTGPVILSQETVPLPTGEVVVSRVLSNLDEQVLLRVAHHDGSTTHHVACVSARAIGEALIRAAGVAP